MLGLDCLALIRVIYLQQKLSILNYMEKDFRSVVQNWLDGNFDEATKAEIRALQENDLTALEDAFYRNLEFGTGGLRGIMGVGTNRMNKYTVGMATQGLANYMKANIEGPLSVCISFDSRNNSPEFAQITANVLSANGIKVYIFDKLHPIALMSYSVRSKKANAGIMITASHNPKEYNGYKVYDKNGCQIVTDAAKKISGGNVETDSLHITVNTKDEIGTLSAVLSETYAKIQEYTAYINALAYKDSLTNIKNTTAYSEMIKELNDGIGLNNSLFGVLVADINNLKITNDNYGHDIGDELIIRTSKLLTETFKDSPVFRVGGDEFVVILQNMDFVNHLSLLEKFDEICSKEVITVGEEKLTVSVAKGVASYNPETDKAYKDVFARADQAMYNNKEEMKKAQKNEQ